MARREYWKQLNDPYRSHHARADRAKRHPDARTGPFVVPVADGQFDGLVCEIGRNHRHQPTAKVRSTLGSGLK